MVCGKALAKNSRTYYCWNEGKLPLYISL